MNREEFLALPHALQIRVLFDALDEGAARFIRELEPVKPPRPPKYDQMIFRSGGVMWASECDLEGLRFWHKRSVDGLNDPKYGDNNRKRAEALARFIAWRECYPDAAWSGERDRNAVVARVPSSKPTVYARNGGGPARPPAPPPEDDINPDSELPF